MNEVSDELLVSARPLSPGFEKQQRINEQLGVDRQVRINPVVVGRLRDAEVLRESHG